MADIGEPSRRHKVIPLDHPIRETPREPVAPPLPERRITRAIPFAGIRAGEIIAPRVWTLYGNLLHGAFFMGHAWLPHVPVRGDLHVEGAGIHAFKSFDEAFKYAEKASDWIFPNGNVVVGHVALWGDVIEHEHGYRAEHGSVYDIVSVTRYNIELDALCRHYGCEIAQP